jgi:hypothetical protein
MRLRTVQILRLTILFLPITRFNRSGHSYHNVYLGNWTDTDVGLYTDDFIGCDVGRSAYYGYNGATCDGTGGTGEYGCGPPAQGILMLQGPLADPGDGIDNNHNGVIDEPGETWVMSKYLYYNDNFDTVNGNPVTDVNYYNYLRGKWKNGQPMTYGGNGIGGTLKCDYMYPGSSDPTGWGTNHVPQPLWSEVSVANTPGDRRGLGSYGPFTLSAGSQTCVDFAYTWARDTNNITSLNKLQTYTDTVRQYFTSHQLDQCIALGPNAVPEHMPKSNLLVYPNPCTNQLNLRFDSGADVFKAEIFDYSGKLVLSMDHLNSGEHVIDVSVLSRGMYFIKVQNTKGMNCVKFIRE